MLDHNVSELITDEEAAELAAQLFAGITGKPQRDSTTSVLMQVIDWLAGCDADMRETNAETLESAILAASNA